MEEIGDRTTVFEFSGLRDRQCDYIDWALKSSLEQGVEPDQVITEEAATMLTTKLKTPLQIGRRAESQIACAGRLHASQAMCRRSMAR